MSESWELTRYLPLLKSLECLPLFSSLCINSFKAEIFAISCEYQRTIPNRYSMKVRYARLCNVTETEIIKSFNVAILVITIYHFEECWIRYWRSLHKLIVSLSISSNLNHLHFLLDFQARISIHLKQKFCNLIWMS